MGLLRLLLLVSVVCAVTVPAVAQTSPWRSDPLVDGGVAQAQGDYATALRLWRPLAEQGNAVAQVLLGGLYEDGQGVPQDYAAAAAWYRKGAEQGAAGAQYSLGHMYENGKGVPQDYVQAHKWFNLAAANTTGSDGIPLAEVKRMQADYAKDRDAVAAKMTPAQIAEAQRLAREWKPKPER
jgi:uncharacterized protein